MSHVRFVLAAAVEILLAVGADHKHVDHEEGKSAIDVARARGKGKVVKLLKEKDEL